jgi:hypothetical protein
MIVADVIALLGARLHRTPQEILDQGVAAAEAAISACEDGSCGHAEIVVPRTSPDQWAWVGPQGLWDQDATTTGDAPYGHRTGPVSAEFPVARPRGDYIGGGGLLRRGCCGTAVGWPHDRGCAQAGGVARY